MPLRGFGTFSELDCHKEAMPYNMYLYTYENVNNGSASIHSALDILNESDKQHL